MVTLEQLRVLQALDKAAGVSQAAEQLGKAQSAVSYTLKTLEESLGVTLLDRSTYRARLTAAGQAVLKKGQQILAMTDELDSLAAEFRGGCEARVDILLDGILPVASIMPVLQPLVERRGPTQIRLRVELVGGVAEAIESTQPDLVLAPMDLYGTAAPYEKRIMGEAVMLPVVATEHPLARFTPPVPIAELRRHIHLVVSDSSKFKAPIDAGLVGADTVWNFPDFHSRLEGLRAGLGFAWMPTYLIEQDVRANKLTPLRLERHTVQRFQVALAHRTSPPLGRTGRHLLELMASQKDFLPPPNPELLKLVSGG
ncbi:MAG TPA: LysR family transcriptional regulator [bacterium]